MSTPAPAVVQTGLRTMAVLSLLIGAVAVRVVVSARAELQQADALAAAGDAETALVHYRRAARWYAPGSPYHVRALQRLGEMGARSERAGDVDAALAAYRAVRGSILATRSFYVPERERLEAANERIADLMASLPPPPMDAGKSREQLRKEHLALLERQPGPALIWTLVLLCGFACWVGGAFAFAARAIDAEDRWVPAQARRWGSVVVLGFALFVLGMSLA